MTQLKVAAFLIFLQICFTGNAASAERPVPLMQELPALRQSLLRGKISKVVMFYYSPTGETRHSLSPSDLERIYDQKLVVRLPSRFNTVRALPDVLEKTSVSRLVNIGTSKGSDDFRTGCVFFNTHGSRVLSFYIDGTGTVGLINGKLIILHGKLYPWLRTLPSAVSSKAAPQ